MAWNLNWFMLRRLSKIADALRIRLQWFPGQRFGKTFGFLDRFCMTYQAMSIFCNGQDIGHVRPSEWPTILWSLVKTNCRKLASSSNPLDNLYLIVHNWRKSHLKLIVSASSVFKNFSGESTFCTFLFMLCGVSPHVEVSSQ